MEKKKLTLEELFKEFNNLIYFEIRKHLSDSELIKECGQEVMIKIFKEYEKISFLDYNAQAVYIGKIARGTAINIFNKETRYSNKIMPLDTWEDELEEAQEYVMADVVIDSEVDYSISQISESEREIIELFYYKEYSHEQIAAILNISVEASRKRLSRAKASLKKQIEKERKIISEM